MAGVAVVASLGKLFLGAEKTIVEILLFLSLSVTWKNVT